jgi:hypothetical protein
VIATGETASSTVAISAARAPIDGRSSGYATITATIDNSTSGTRNNASDGGKTSERA